MTVQEQIEELRGFDRDELLKKAAEFGVVVDLRDINTPRWPSLDSIRLTIIEKMIERLHPEIQEPDDWLLSAKRLHSQIGGFRGNGPEELGAVAAASAAISVAEDTRAIRELLESALSD